MLGEVFLFTWRVPLLVCEVTKEAPQPIRAEAIVSMGE